MSHEVHDAVRNMFRRATLSADATVDADHVRGSFTGRNGETFTQVPRISDYGFHSEPLAGASAVLAALSGRSDGVLALGIDDPRKRPSLGPGAVALYNAQGNMISLVQQTIRIVSSQPVAVTAPSMTINGHTVLTA
jgi:phage baseplate assembly protein V